MQPHPLCRSSQAALTVGTWVGEEGAGGLQAATGRTQEWPGQAGGGRGPEPPQAHPTGCWAPCPMPLGPTLSLLPTRTS